RAKSCDPSLGRPNRQSPVPLPWRQAIHPESTDPPSQMSIASEVIGDGGFAVRGAEGLSPPAATHPALVTPKTGEGVLARIRWVTGLSGWPMSISSILRRVLGVSDGAAQEARRRLAVGSGMAELAMGTKGPPCFMRTTSLDVLVS